MIAMLMALSLALALLTACGNSSSSSTDGGSGSGSGTADKTYELSFSIHDPATSAKVAYYQQLCDEVYEQTNGGVKITIYPGGTLLASTDVAEGILRGSADIGWIYTTFFPGQFPLTEVVTLPMTYTDSTQATNVLLDLFDQSELLQEELSNYKILGMTCNPMNYIYSTTPVRTVSDLKGLSIRATAGVATDLVNAWGGSPVVMGPGDMYEAIEKGVLQGYVFEWSGNNSFNLGEVVDYCTELPMFCGVFLVAMNQDSWNKLPAEYQEIIDSIWNRDASMGLVDVFMDDVEAGRSKGIEQGVEIITPDDAAIAEFQPAADEYVKNWISTYDAQDYYDLAMEIAANY